MKIEMLLKMMLGLLVVALVVVIVSWVSSESRVAVAEGGGGAASGDWMMVASQIVDGDGYIYMFNANKEVLLVYAFYRTSPASARSSARFNGDLEFLAGRHCKWDVLYSQLEPYPYVIDKRHSVPSGIILPPAVKAAYERASGGKDK